ncbi:hypothetical protein ILYODFUR_014669, partial [Ilyodon furcidens]
GFSEELVLVLASEPRDEGFEEEAPPDPVSEGFKEQLVLVLASEPRYEGFKEEAPPDPVSEGFKVQLVLVLTSEGHNLGSPLWWRNLLQLPSWGLQTRPNLTYFLQMLVRQD